MVKLLIWASGAAAAVTASACAGESSVARGAEEQSCTERTLVVTTHAPAHIGHLDIFVYQDTLTRPLVAHIRADGPEAEFRCGTGGRIAVAVANCPGQFNLDALGRFESAEMLTMYYRMENPREPLMSAWESFCCDSLDLDLTPLLCRVLVLSIDNRTDSPLMKAELYLRNVNASAEMLRSDGFRSQETISKTDALDYPEMMRATLPGNLGEGTFCPGTVLYCYPDESGSSLTHSGTEIVLGAVHNGERREWAFPLGKTLRGGTVNMNLIVE